MLLRRRRQRQCVCVRMTNAVTKNLYTTQAAYFARAAAVASAAAVSSSLRAWEQRNDHTAHTDTRDALRQCART